MWPRILRCLLGLGRLLKLRHDDFRPQLGVLFPACKASPPARARPPPAPMCAPDGASPGRRGNLALPSASPPVDGKVLAAQASPTARAQLPTSAAPWPASWASASDDDEDDEGDEEELAPPLVTSAAVLAVAVSPARKADPATAGRLARPPRPQSVLALPTDC